MGQRTRGGRRGQARKSERWGWVLVSMHGSSACAHMGAAARWALGLYHSCFGVQGAGCPWLQVPETPQELPEHPLLFRPICPRAPSGPACPADGPRFRGTSCQTSAQACLHPFLLLLTPWGHPTPQTSHLLPRAWGRAEAAADAPAGSLGVSPVTPRPVGSGGCRAKATPGLLC